MESILASKITPCYELCHDFLKAKLNNKSIVVILPWAFPQELDYDRFQNEYFKEGSEKYNKYVLPLLDLGVLKENIKIINPYDENHVRVEELLTNSDCLILPGGNPEMMFRKVIHDFNFLYLIKFYKGLIIGESAGAELQLKRYFITAKNNYYKYFAFYDGFGILDDDFYFDVHSSQNYMYLKKLQNIAYKTKKDVYAIFNDGAIIIDRETKKIEIKGHVIKYEGK